jgi:FkbM family methyltransferase
MKISVNNIEFEVDTNGVKYFWNAVSKEQWETESFNVIDRFLPENGIFIDIGCWAGPFVLYAASKGCRVYAIDPDPEALLMLDKNLILNNSFIDKVSIHRHGISAFNSSMKLYVRKALGQSSSSLIKRVNDTKFVEVETLTFQDFIERNKLVKADLIKIDIEGAEWDLIPSMIAPLRSFNFPTLYISTHYNYLIEGLVERTIGNKWLGKLFFKILRKFSIHLFRKQTSQAFHQFMTISKDYKYTYDSFGKLMTMDNLEKSGFLYKNKSLVFSNEKWR